MLSRPLASISSDPLEGLKVTAANRFKNILIGSFDPTSLPYALLKSQIDDQAVRATAAGTFNRKWEISTPTKRAFAKAATYEDEPARRIAELASYKNSPTPLPTNGGGLGRRGGGVGRNLGENLGETSGLSGTGAAKTTEAVAQTAVKPTETLTPAQAVTPTEAVVPNLQKPNLTPQTAEKVADAVTPNLQTKLLQNLDKSPQFGRDMFILSEENLSGDIVKWAEQNNKRIAINKLDLARAQELGFNTLRMLEGRLQLMKFATL